MTPRTYASPEAFKQALEQRLRTPAKSGADSARKRQLLVFDRFLARVVDVFGGAVTLKGGLVLEFRLARARTTKDVDLRMVTHALPPTVPAPPEAWEAAFTAMAKNDQLTWTTLNDVTMAVREFLDPVLAGGLDATWSPSDWAWLER